MWKAVSVASRERRCVWSPPPPPRSAAFRPCHYPHLFRTHISTSTWYSKTPGKPRELGLPPSTDGVHALSAKSCATARRSRAADHRFVKRSGIMTYIISLTQQTLQKMWVMTRPSGCRSPGLHCTAIDEFNPSLRATSQTKGTAEYAEYAENGMDWVPTSAYFAYSAVSAAALPRCGTGNTPSSPPVSRLCSLKALSLPTSFWDLF